MDTKGVWGKNQRSDRWNYGTEYAIPMDMWSLVTYRRTDFERLSVRFFSRGFCVQRRVWMVGNLPC